MKTTVYKCDACGAILSDEMQGIEHISVSFNRSDSSGWVEPCDAPQERWRFRGYVTGIMQFCNPDCLKMKFEDLRGIK